MGAVGAKDSMSQNSWQFPMGGVIAEGRRWQTCRQFPMGAVVAKDSMSLNSWQFPMGAVFTKQCMLQLCRKIHMTAVVVKDSNRKCVGNFQWELSSPKNACCKHVGQFPMTHTANVSAMSNGSCLCRKVNATSTSENVRYGSCGRQCLNLRAYQQHQCHTAVVWLDSMRSACLQVAVASSLSNYMASAQWMTPSNKATRASQWPPS